MFIIKTPNPNYNGVTNGVKFVDGIGKTDNEVIKRILVNDFGYIAEATKDEPKSNVKKVETKNEPKKVQSKSKATTKSKSKKK